MRYVNGVSALYIRKFARKLEQYNCPGPLPDYFGPMIGEKKRVRIAEVGAGPINTIGNTWPGVEVEVVASDILAHEYKALWLEHGDRPVVPIWLADMESLPYDDESFDVVHCVNALDHTPDAEKALSELLRVCKPGGWVYLRHAPDQRRRFGGHHYFDVKKCGDVCIFEGKDRRFVLPSALFTVHLEGDLIVATCRKT